ATIMKGATQKRRIEVHIEGTSDLPLIEADRAKLKQVFFNLISNAVKFSPKRSIIRIAARVVSAETSVIKEEAVEIAFIDHGIGISEDDFDKIFQPFRQADSGISRQFGGTGLGLALVKNYVRNHNGRVLLESKVGEGSTFTVVLPLRSRGRASAAQPEVTEAEFVLDGRILVLENDLATLHRITTDLESLGIEVVSATTGEQAIELVREMRPTAIVLDIVLPGIDGWEVFREIKINRASAWTPVVICSHLGNEHLAVALWADDYFLKPLGIERLVVRVAELLKVEGPEAERLLVIDDDPMVHEQLEARMVPMGYRLQHALSGKKGLARATADPPALIILDLMMDEMGGIEVAMGLQSQKKTADIPIIVLTAAELSEEDHRRMRGKITAFVRKGEDERGILATVVRRLLVRQGRVRAGDSLQ
ncbi:MAG: response regulator, partial [Thermoanaerobaculales bacterium]|nr:response regulator [Thermoanaerobaculales bacterium]